MTVLNKDEVSSILTILSELYPDARPALHYENAFELLIAAILSAQCTDVRVNIVTDELFKEYRAPGDFAKLSVAELMPKIKSCGLYRTKAEHIIGACNILVEKYGSTVPRDFDALTSLPGVGRKVANVVLSNAFGIPAIAVDTHVFRVSNRMGLASAKTPEKTELDLKACIPMEMWGRAHHLLIFHGRNVCKAQKPACDKCRLSGICAKVGLS